MWGVTTAATLGFDRHMFINKGTRFVRMAFGADGISGRQSPHLPESRRSMHVVAVTAVDKAFVHPVVVGLGEISLCRGVTPVAERRLGRCEQMLRFLCVVGRMTVKAADIAAGVG